MDQGRQVGLMIAWEQGETTKEEEIELFQHLVNSGLAWQLQGVYGRHAARLLEAEIIQPKGMKTNGERD